MHYGYYDGGNGVHWGAAILMLIFALLVFGALAWIIVTLLRHGESHRHAQPEGAAPPDHGPDALKILDERLARGEIDGEDYKYRRSLLKGE